MASYELLRNIERRSNTANALLRAINFGDQQRVEALLNSEHNFDLSQADYVIQATKLGYFEIVETLILYGANPNQSRLVEYSSYLSHVKRKT